MSADVRAAVLRAVGASTGEVDELLRYGAPAFAVPVAPAAVLPLSDEPFVDAWVEYVADAAQRGAWVALRDRLPQLRFPIAAGMSETAPYQAATRRGAPAPGAAPGLVLEAPEGVHLHLHPSPAGRVPVLVFERRADFVAVTRALTARNEPVPVPDAQGARMIAGYNNWDRVARLRAAFARGELSVGAADTWAEAFAHLRGRKELYQDACILLSAGPYSGVTAASVGLSDATWERLSTVIRLEHECAHYFTRRAFGAMGKGLLDELIADYAGLTSAVHRFRADWFLRFLGLEDPTRYRTGGRLESYRGTPPLSDGAFAVLQTLVRRAAAHVEAVDLGTPPATWGWYRWTLMTAALATLSLEEVAADDGAARLRARLATPALAGYAPPVTAERAPAGDAPAQGGRYAASAPAPGFARS